MIVPVTDALLLEGLFLADGLDESSDVAAIHGLCLISETADAKPALDLAEMVEGLACELIQAGDDIAATSSLYRRPVVFMSIRWDDASGPQHGLQGLIEESIGSKPSVLVRLTQASQLEVLLTQLRGYLARLL